MGGNWETQDRKTVPALVRNSPLATRSFLYGYPFVLGAGTIWGTLGLFFTVLHDDFGLSALAIGFLRAGVAALISTAVLLLFRRSDLRVSRRALALYAGFGLCGVALLYIFYAEAVLLTSVATASVLLYTAPAFVTLYAAWQFREPLTRRKLGVLALMVLGSALVSKAYNPAELQLSLVGVFCGLGSGLTYASYTVFAKYAHKQPAWTSVTYSLIFGALFLLPLQFFQIPGLSGRGLAPVLENNAVWIFVLGLSLGPTLGSYALYNVALQRVPASNASLVATIEPVVAALGGWLLFGQMLAPLQIVGAAMILGGAALLSMSG